MHEWLLLLSCFGAGYLISCRNPLFAKRLSGSVLKSIWLIISFFLVIIFTQITGVGIPSIGLNVMSANDAKILSTYFIVALLAILIYQIIMRK